MNKIGRVTVNYQTDTSNKVIRIIKNDVEVTKEVIISTNLPVRRSLHGLLGMPSSSILIMDSLVIFQSFILVFLLRLIFHFHLDIMIQFPLKRPRAPSLLLIRSRTRCRPATKHPPERRILQKRHARHHPRPILITHSRERHITEDRG
ncbi:hypothetical protein PENTCL1PPCAC_18894 [Pristionchus entomophagus]|uniref:G protein-coupled receptor n=1 Tax=Pristionchus entomophagus TaxID=358040 RepID=A0AAV5TQM3_9BILA|nr:hypothetical protein PENTCL1PPCAC_18894 [Pristionchus entomophagus]